MGKWSQFLVVYDQDDEVYDKVREILDEQNALFKSIDNTFFFETSSRARFKDVSDSLKKEDVKFLLFLNANVDGDAIRHNNIGGQDIATIRQLLL